MEIQTRLHVTEFRSADSRDIAPGMYAEAPGLAVPMSGIQARREELVAAFRRRDRNERLKQLAIVALWGAIGSVILIQVMFR